MNHDSQLHHGSSPLLSSRQHRARRTAAERREQKKRSDTRFLLRLLDGISSIARHRGNTLSVIGKAVQSIAHSRTKQSFMHHGDRFDSNSDTQNYQYTKQYWQYEYDPQRDSLLEQQQYVTGDTVEQQCATIETAAQQHTHDVDNRDGRISDDDRRDVLLEEQLSAATLGDEDRRDKLLEQQHNASRCAETPYIANATVDATTETLEPTCNNFDVDLTVTNCNDDDNTSNTQDTVEIGTSEAPIGLVHAEASTSAEVQQTESQIDGTPQEQLAVQSKAGQSSNDPTSLVDLAASGDPIFSGDPTASGGPTVARDPTATDDPSAVAGDLTASLVSAEAPCAYLARSRRAERLRSKQAWQPVDAQQAARDLDAMRSLELDKTYRLGGKSSSKRWKPGLTTNIETLDINATTELILAGQDLAAVTMRQLRNQIEEWHGLPAEALASRKDEIKESATRFLNKRL